MRAFYYNFLALIFCVLIISITPVAAVEMEEVAHAAEKYQEQSKEKMSFFNKISFMAKGFQLVNNAKKAQKESEKKLKEKSNNTEPLNNSSETQQKQLLTFKNRNKEDNNTSAMDKELLTACEYDANILIKELQEQKIILTQNNIADINKLKNHFAQIIDNNGHLRYVYISQITNKTITLKINNNTEQKINQTEFQKIYTGITLKNPENLDTNTILNEINTFQQQELTQKKEGLQEQQKQHKNNNILYSILLGTAILLLIIGAVLATIFGKTVINTFLEESQIEGNIKVNPIEIFNDWGPPRVHCPWASSFTIVPLSLTEIIENTVIQNWVQVILCTIGLILFICGLGLLIYSIIELVRSVKNLKHYNKQLKDLNTEEIDLYNWQGQVVGQ